MSVSEKHSGIVDQHVRAIEQTAAARDTFIFVRPTEYDSTILIRAGYATKSMDVHHKSSNWGPMAGFVPCDPAFSKKCEGTPNPNEAEHKHGAAYPVQLALKPGLLASHEKIEMQTGYLLAAATEKGGIADVPWVVKRVQDKAGSVAAKRARFEAFQQAGGAIPEHKFCTAKPTDFGNKSTLFCLIEKGGEWLVYWVGWQGETGRLNPLRVFGYSQSGKLNPVTGDYDLWMVAPHCSHLDQHAITRIEKDTHGSSAASGFTMTLMAALNSSCGRADNPVFNHGAEAQNYGFTQALDWNLAMFTPGGTSRMVRMNQTPGILGDLQTAGYLVVWNKRYGEIDPSLMGCADKRGLPTMTELRSTLDKLFSELAEIRRNANPAQVAKSVMQSHSGGRAQMPAIMKNELGLMAQRIGAQRNLGTEQSRIYRFHRQLLDFLGSQSSALKVLSPVDFGPKFRTYDSQIKPLHARLQQVLVEATTGSGQSAEAKLNDWLSKNGSQIEQLKRYWS
jgi:hypothetical protein